MVLQKKEYGMVGLEIVSEVLIRCLLLDNVKLRYEMIFAELFTIFVE